MKNLLKIHAPAIAAVALAALPGRAETPADEVETPDERPLPFLHFHAFADVETAYICRGYVWDTRPFSAQYASGEIDMGAFGRLDGYVWTMSAMSSKGHSTSMRNAYNEVDYGIRYAYDIEFTEDWKLTSGAARQWVTNPGVRHGGHSLIDWQAFQALHNPFVTPYWKLRYIQRPYNASYWCLGLKRSFGLTEKLEFTVDFFGDFGDSRHFKRLFGPKPGHEESNYHGGIHALNLVLRLDYALTEYLGIYAFVGQFSLVSQDARDAVGASTAKEAKRDLTYGGIGIKFDF